MLKVEEIYETFLKNGVDFFTGVPDSLLKNMCAYITDNTCKEKHIIAANEGAAIGIAAGHYLATGNPPLVYMQNSGIGNTVNPLLSLADPKVYSMPILLMIGWRGEPGVKDEPQHIKQGEVTLDLLNAMQIPYIILEDDATLAIPHLEQTISQTKETSSPHAIVIRKGLFDKYKLLSEEINDYPLSREDALKVVVDHLNNSDILVSTTGKLSRELFEYRDAKHQPHANDFLTVGSMGHSSSIALGISLGKPNRRVFCMDGDGAFIMHMGAISNIGYLSPKNYFHILFNNGAHESVGGQPTLGFKIDFPSIAKNCGYNHVYSVQTQEEIESVLSELPKLEGPLLMEIKVCKRSREDLGRPTVSPIENKKNFMESLKK